MNKDFIVRQQDLKDCGVCSLLSIIKYYGGFIPLEKLRVDTQTSLEGTTAYHLVKAAENYGLNAYGAKLEKISDLENIVLPAIAHVIVKGFNHFLVIYKVTKNEIIVMDPAKGKVKMKKQEFESIWTNHVIILYPNHELPNITNKNYMVQMLLAFFKTERKSILKIIFLTALFTILTIFTGFYFKIGMQFLNDFEKNSVITLIILFLFLTLIKLLANYLRNHFKLELNKNLDGYLYYHFIKHLFWLPNYFIKDRTTGEIMIRIKELENSKEVFSEIFITIFLDSILAFSVGIILYYISKALFFLLCLIVLLYVICGIISGNILYKKALATNDAEVNFQSKMVESIDSCISLKNLNSIKTTFKKVEVHLFKYLNKLLETNQMVLKTSSVSFFLEELLSFGVISIGLLEIMNKNMSLVDLITFESLVVFFVNPFKNGIQLLPNYNYVKVGLEKANDFYNIPEEKENEGLQEFQNGDITIEHLSFSYNPLKKLFVDVSLEIKERDFVLFKGPSGCGKSTLCQMLSRLIEVKNNNIKIRNVSINDYSLQAIRKNITYVGQKENLMQDTIINNILLERTVPEERLKEILTLCEIEDIVNKKPLRYQTFLAKDAVNISGGEKQRIILARALLNDFQILILDEALSELNNDLEIKIIKNLKKYLKDKTIIYVSHKNHEKYFHKVYDFGEML